MRKVFQFLGGFLIALLMLEFAFRALPVSTATLTGYYIHPHILTYPQYHTFTTSTGWDLKNARRHRANNYGFLAARDFFYSPAALGLIGDSFVEANMLLAEDRLAPRLESALGGRPVYALGGPGSSLLDYAERIHFAYEAFGIRQFLVVIERGDIKQSLCGSGHNHGPCLDPITLKRRVEFQPEASTLKKILRESALAQYLFSQLKINPAAIINKLKRPTPKSELPKTESPSGIAVAKATIENFFQLIELPSEINLIFLIDADRSRLFDDLAQQDLGIEFFKASAISKGMQVISPLSTFRDYRTKSGLILEVGPYDAHWNSEAVRVVAELLGSELR